MLSKQKIIQINTLLARLIRLRRYAMDKNEKAGIVMEFSGGRVSSTKELNVEEADSLIQYLQTQVSTPVKFVPKSGERQRRHIIAMFHEMGYQLDNGKIDMEAVNAWCVQHGYLHKVLNSYAEDELPLLVTQCKKYLEYHIINN